MPRKVDKLRDLGEPELAAHKLPIHTKFVSRAGEL